MKEQKPICEFNIRVRCFDDPDTSSGKWWFITSPELPGLMLMHENLEFLMEDILPAARKLIELNRQDELKLVLK